ncbi:MULTISPECIES: maleylpyruvate isomerase N-terminal domain-containing protein [Micrococcaceae]|uniref:maleylpyruvate isomerase N-terminal domain-containing protein n=1 Tax=Micrococcaceae TaxID=1268 RepID=UPI00105B69AF
MPAPCTAWTVRDLLDHPCDLAQATGQALEGDPAVESPAGQRPGAQPDHPLAIRISS